MLMHPHDLARSPFEGLSEFIGKIDGEFPLEWGKQRAQLVAGEREQAV